MTKTIKTGSDQKHITPRAEDFSEWYHDVISAAELAEHAPVKGCMVIKPHGYAIWENIQKKLDARFKETGVSNAYFPLFIPEEFLMKEKEHVKGFSPELAVVTHAGGEKLETNLIVRPTSETIIYHMFSKWIHSWRDLPLVMNQWANVVRWEKRPRLFVRTTEFLWQEGHTAHATFEEAEREAQNRLELYKEFCNTELAIPVFVGRKSDSEKFAGALHTYTIEAMMQDGKALQAGTSHNLGDNFSRVFEIEYTDTNGEKKYVWQTSWGMSTRVIGALIMTHGDDKGIVLPPRVAPIQVVIVPITKDEDRERIVETAQGVARDLSEFRVKLDDRDYLTPGWKFNEWEKMGVCLRIEIGPKDISKKQIILVRRDTGEKSQVSMNEVNMEVRRQLEEMQEQLYERALKFRDDHTFEVNSWDEFKDVIENGKGFAKAFWCGDAVCELQIKEDTKATTRCIPFVEVEETGTCVYCKKNAPRRVLFAKAY